MDKTPKANAEPDEDRRERARDILRNAADARPIPGIQEPRFDLMVGAKDMDRKFMKSFARSHELPRRPRLQYQPESNQMPPM